MPLYQHSLLHTGASVWIWHLTETLSDLQWFLSDEDFNAICRLYHLPSRRLQKMITRLLLDKLESPHRIDIQYDELGKPELKGIPGTVSISHSREHIGLLYHPTRQAGLDLEEVSPRIMKIASRFLHPVEKLWIRKEQELADTALVWSAKEALFKTIGGGGIHFAQDLLIHEPKFTDVDNGHGTAEYQGHKGHFHFDYHFKYLEGVLMVHTIAKD